MKLALLALGLFAAGCAHAKTLSETLAEIDTSHFALPTAQGPDFSLAAQRGHVVVLEFMASWCVPCLAEVNQLAKLRERNPEARVAAVLLDPDAALSAKAFVSTTGVTFPVLIADAATRNGSGPFGRIPALPTTAIVDPSGVVRSAFPGLVEDADLDALVRQAQAR